LRSYWRCLLLTASQIGTVISFVNIVSVLMVIGKAFSNEVFALVSHGWLHWETYFFSIKDSLVSYDCHLGFVVPKGFHAEQKFKENYTN